MLNVVRPSKVEITSGPVLVSTGFPAGFTVTTTLSLAVHPFSSVTVSVRVAVLVAASGTGTRNDVAAVFVEER